MLAKIIFAAFLAAEAAQIALTLAQLNSTSPNVQLTQKQTLYPVFKGRGFSSAFSLQDGQAMLFTFSGKLKLKDFGFWSLTVYGASGYLIPNPLGRFEVGDRTEGLVYRNGNGNVYGADAKEKDDWEFQILLQPVGSEPPKNWTSNWLPVENDFSLILRFYVPEPAMTNGSYVYPKVENITAII